MHQSDKMFKKNNEGVSPVIGVILMVAITVVLAAVVFVLVNNLSHNAAHAPINLGVTRSSDNSFSITQIEDSISYANLTIKDNGVVQSYTVNGVSPSSSAKIVAGDVIRVSGLTTGSHRVSFITNNQVIYSSEFTV
jgi:flagellin-like protein